MSRPRWELLNEYEEHEREAWHALAAVLDHSEASSYGPYRTALAAALDWLETNAGCGDCVGGRCHWGGEASRESIAAAKAGREFREECGCRRHPFSVEVRQRKRATSA